MKYVIVSVHDRAAAAYGRPIFTMTAGQAIRSFQDEINRPHDQNEMHRHPEDFDLYELATFDDHNGKFTNLEEPKQLAIGKNLKTNGA